MIFIAKTETREASVETHSSDLHPFRSWLKLLLPSLSQDEKNFTSDVCFDLFQHLTIQTKHSAKTKTLFSIRDAEGVMRELKRTEF